MKNKKVIVSAALAGLAVGALSVSASANADEVKCWGANKCGADSPIKEKDSSSKERAKCSVTESDKKIIEEAVHNGKLEKKYAKVDVHDCGTHAKCAGAKGNVNWFYTSAKKCKELGGFLIDKGAVKKL
ncbi:hypothetical protein [Fluviispira sanaruensis]|uniref:Uncharacterized protein n=1 Tax=Fluviispira sanaruensis TaxID=2493639 RepID=A0A4P2VJV3_FLUSA|nr:hypothetical protein [Fluviispira sanaruensis]BBH53523.1 hypothetical protein JCM31447_19670 [Fluviispira sanaruensis]